MASPLAHLLHGDSNLSPRTPPALNTGASNVVPLIVPNSGASLAPPSTTTSGAAQASSATPPALPPQAPRSHANTASLYQCADCLRRYSRPEHLQRHIATHTLGKRFQCDVCGKLFSRADLLKRHRANHDNDNGTKRRRINSSPGAGRVAHACQACARARVKCEDLKPCTRCRNRNLTCEYASSEAGSAAAMHLLHLSANAHSNVNAPPPSSSDQDSPQSPYYPPPPAAQHQAPAVLPHNLPTVTLVIKTANESPVLTTNNPPLNPEEAQLPTPETMMDQSNPDNFQAPYPAHNVVDMARLPFSDFLRDVLYEPSGLEAQGIAALDYFLDSNENLELNDIDFGLLDHWNVDGMTDRATGHQGATWHTDDINDMSKMRQRLVKIWTESPWRWNPNKLDSGYVEQSNLPLPSEEASVAKFRESRKRLDRTSKERLESSSRDKILAIVLSTCRNNSIMTRVASSFPSVDVMDFLIQNFLASHMCQVTQWIHFGSLTLNSQWPEWLGAAAAAGAVLTPVQTLRKFGFALQEAVRITIPSRFEDANSTIGDPGAVGALILLQDIGLWSGNRRKMEISESHLSIPIAMMRYRGKFHRSTYPPIELAGSDEGDVLEAKFKSFYQAETWKRMVFHAYIRDAQISMTTLTNPSMSYAELTLPLPEAKELWFSKTASEWKPQFLQRVEAKRPPSLRDLLRDINLLSANLQRLDVQFAISIYLHGFWSLIWEWRQLDAVHRSTVQSPAASGNPNLLLASRHDELCKALKNFQLVTADWHEMLSAQECLVLNLLLMNMYVSLDDLQLFAGKEGEDQARRVYPILQKWSDSSEARQALWHAGQILRQAKLFPVGHLKDFYAIAVHHAALALWTHGVVTKARRPSTSPVGYEPVCLDGPDSSFVSRYIHFGHGRAVIRGPGCKEEAGSAENYLDAADPRACMDVAMETLRSNFIDGQDSLPPITENICQTLKQLGNAAWAVGLG